jgi:hypothetical protein
MNEGVKDLFDFYPERVLSLFNEEQKEYMYKVNTRKEILAINYCINYSIPLRFVRFTNIKIIKYEDLFENPIKTIKMLGKFAGFKYSKSVKNAINKKSFTVRSETKKIKDYNPRLAWRKNFSDDEISNIVDIIKTFNLEEYLDI